MSFITKRERVFKEYSDAVSLPQRDEGKLKAYSSCTDARAWSHFCTDKTEHLVEIIKRSSEVCKGKYVPCNVIIEMMMAAKNAEIARLKRKITQLEQMLLSYDQLDLTCDQKCEISTAHAIIRAANKSLDAVPPLELNTSNFTEGIDSESFQTGKSGGDEPSIRFKGVEWPNSGSVKGEKGAGQGLEELQGYGPLGYDPLGYEDLGLAIKASKASRNDQSSLTERCSCDVSTSAVDPRVDELKESLIGKDAKLNAMQNTIAVMENDVCEPYCIYAHIFTALEKIFGTLRQNEKYRMFLDLMLTGKDTRCLDIKGKILFKLKILEKFSVALISPCSERFKYDETCECYAAQVETTFGAASTPESQKNPSDLTRTQLIVDIMENDEMKEIITKENSDKPTKTEDGIYDVSIIDNYSIDTENISRLKTLQMDYEDLMTAYENVKHERDNLKTRCQKYENMEKELEDCQTKIREYNSLFTEREYYRKRSEDLDSLKEQYLLLSNETSSLETQLKAEGKINHMKGATIDELQTENISLETKLNELTIAFEKERNAVLCKLKEAECTIMCQEQQIKSLTSQIDRILEQSHGRPHDVLPTATIMDEMESLKDQIKSLNDALYTSEDEKQHLQEHFENQLKLINKLRMEIEEWKSMYEKTLHRNEYLEKYTEGFEDEVRRLVEENRILSQEVEEKSQAVANLISVINNKSQEANKLMNDIQLMRDENRELKNQLQDIGDKYGISMAELENEKREVMDSLQIARQESKELLNRVKDYEDVIHKTENISKSLAEETENCKELKNMLVISIEQNKKLQQDLSSQENNNSILLQEIQRLREINNFAVDNINTLQNEKEKYKNSYEVVKKESQIINDKLKEFDDLRDQLQKMKQSHEMLLNKKNELENDLRDKVRDLDDVMHSVELTKRESEHLLVKVEQSESLKEDMIKLSKDYRKLVDEKQLLQNDLTEKNKELDDLLSTLAQLKAKNETLLEKTKNTENLEQELENLKKAYNDLGHEKLILQRDFDNKTQEINHLYNTLEGKIEENRELLDQVKILDKHHTENFNKLQDVNLTTQTTLQSVRRESEELLNKLKCYQSLLNEYEDLKRDHHQMMLAKERLQEDLDHRVKDMNKIAKEKDELQKLNQNIMAHSEDLEKALTNTREELINTTSRLPYDDILREIEEMKKDKLANNRKIKELLDKLDESDNIICNMNEDLIARDDRIAILENHINSLEDEVRQLHRSLAEVVGTGEQIKNNSLKKIDQTLHKMEAHHSKATHNMKMELAKLHNEKARLEDELSVTRVKSEDTFRDKHKYVSQMNDLQREREIIVTDIRQLEINCVGDSNLVSTTCCIEDIVNSLDNIQKCIDARDSKTVSLEQALRRFQDSSQLLLSKADEAKNLVEKEKQKIINEKEEAIADRLKMEGMLLDLRAQLERQTIHDQSIIKDLEAEILNQKLIIDKLNGSTQSYISTLEGEIQSLKDLYENSLTQIGDLQEKMKQISDENKAKDGILLKINTDHMEKLKQVSTLQKSLDELKNKQMNSSYVQVGSSNKKKNMKSQTDKQSPSTLDEELGTDKIKYNGRTVDDDITKDNRHLDYDTDIMNANKHSPDRDTNITKVKKNSPDRRTKDMSQSLNEVQILTANIEPSVDLMKSYIDYKKKRHSFSTITDDNETTENTNLIDIFNRDSDLNTESSKAIKTDGENASVLAIQGSKSPKNHQYGISNDTSYSYSKAGPSSEKDLFLIYQDSENSSAADMKSFKEKNTNSRQLPILVETVTLKQDHQLILNQIEDNRDGGRGLIERNKQPHKTIEFKITDDDVFKIIDDEFSGEPMEDVSKNSLPNANNASDQSHRPSRVEEDYILFKGKSNKSEGERQSQPSKDFGLKYILDSVKHEMIHPVTIGDINKKLHKSLSADLYQQLLGSSDGGASIQVPQSNAKTSTSHSSSKPLTEQSVMVNIDATDYYENKIRHLSHQLENTEKDYKKKIDAIKAQYDINIKGIINEHNQGVRSIQDLHEDTLQDIIKIHENEIENLRTMSMDAMRKADKLERENRQMKTKILECGCATLDEEPIKMNAPELKRHRSKCRGDTKMLTKTNIEAFNVKPKLRFHGPCTCSLDVNVSDTIRNIFEQVDVEHRKLAEHAYLKYIANKIMTSNVEALDVHELSFLHLKVCRTWKTKLSKEEALQKKIDTLESELLNKQRCTQQHIAELDRKVAEERHRLQEAREAVCRCSPENTVSQTSTMTRLLLEPEAPHNPPNTEILPAVRSCNSLDVNERRSAGDLLSGMNISTSPLKLKPGKSKPQSRATLVRLDVEERRSKKLTDEPPTRLRRSHERPTRAPKK